MKYLLADHLGSTTLSTDASGTVSASALYKAFGELRSAPSALGTDYRFTGQREGASLGLYFFVARWFDPALGRFTSPDSIVPTSTQGTQAWDRYAFVNNNPVRYTDPTGHEASSTTFTFSSATSFFDYADRTSDAIGTRKDWAVGALEVGAIVGGALAGSLTGGNVLVGVGVGLLGWGVAKAVESAYDTDLTNLADMNTWVTAQFADGATSVDLTIVDTEVTSCSPRGGCSTVIVQTMQVCTNLGVCSEVFESSGIPTNQTLIKQGMDNGTADIDISIEECENDPEAEDCEE